MASLPRAPRLRAIHVPLLLAAIALAVGGLLLGRALAPQDTPDSVSPFARAVAGGHLSLSGEFGWLPARAPTTARGLLPDSTAVTPLGLTGATVIVGDLPPGDVIDLLGRTGAEPGDGRLLTAGSMEARVYDGRLRPAFATTTFLVPSSEGVSSAVCLIDTARSTAAPDDCANVLGSGLRLRSANGLPAAPSEEQRTALLQALARFNAQRRRDGARLAAANTSGRQANAAQALSLDHRAAATAVGSIEMAPLAAEYGRRLIAALGSGAVAYRDIAAATRRRSAGALAAARRRARLADQQTRRALEALQRLGYGRR